MAGLKFEYHQQGKGTWYYSSEIGETIFEFYPLMKNQENPDKSLRLGFTIEKIEDFPFAVL